MRSNRDIFSELIYEQLKPKMREYELDAPTWNAEMPLLHGETSTLRLLCFSAVFMICIYNFRVMTDTLTISTIHSIIDVPAPVVSSGNFEGCLFQH